MTVIPRQLPTLALVLSAFLAGPATAQDTAEQPGPEVQLNQQDQQAQQGQKSVAATSPFIELAPQLTETVVNITADMAPPAPNGQQQQQRSPLPPGTPFEDFFRDFFGDQDGDGDRRGPPRGRGAAVGSGFIIDSEGYIVTNNHVVENATSVTVTLHDETEYEAEVVGRDPRTDLALLKIDAGSDLPTAEWGDSEQVRIAEPVLAIGNPFGLGGSATSGIVSALARDLGIGPYDEFLQTDASINRGNSGGPVFNTRGRVIGVATAIFSPTGGNIGLGFATPSSIAQNVVEQLRESGEVSRGWIGVAIQPVTDEIASAIGLDEARGVVVADVIEGAPAEEAGIQVGDVIVSFDGQSLDDQSRLPRIVADTEIGSTVPLTVWRDGEEVSLEITVGDLSQAPQAGQPDAETPEPRAPGAESGLGLQLAPLDPQARSEFDIDEDVSGVLVAGVDSGSVAAERGLRAGDVIERVGRQDVEQPQEVVDAVSEAQERGDESILVLIRREGSTRFVPLPVPDNG